MGIHAIRMPDIGEGIAEAEISEWLVKPGDVLREDDPMVAVMTDKATVEIPSPVEGKVSWLGGEIGDAGAARAAGAFQDQGLTLAESHGTTGSLRIWFITWFLW